jgi:hypothetical protein
MKKDGRKKLMPLFVTMILLLSLVIFVPSGAANGTVIKVSDDGLQYEDWGVGYLAPGDVITVEVIDGEDDTDYNVTIYDPVDDELIELEDGTTDSDGYLSMDINVPGYHEFGYNPLWDGPDLYELTVWNTETDTDVDSQDILIFNFYKVKYFVDGVEQDHLLWNKEYADNLEFKFYNWTGSDWDLVEDDDAELDVILLDPEENPAYPDDFDSIDSDTWAIDYTFNYTDTDDNLETVYWIYVENQNDADRLSFTPVFVKLDMTGKDHADWDLDDVAWDDTARSVTGYLYDGSGEEDEDHVGGYTVALFAPTLDGYEFVDDATTSGSTGKFTLYFTPNDYGAGTWYVGTLMDGTYRINETYDLNIMGSWFISYGSFTVEADDSAELKVEEPDEVITGFDQTINVSVYDSWDGDYFDEMQLHINGIDCYYDGTEYDSSDIVVIGDVSTGHYSLNEKYAYYEFDILFNETGTATIIATWDLDNEEYTDKTYDNTDLTANITGSTTLNVVAADDINIIIEDPPTEVVVNDGPNNTWINGSNPTTTINVYEDSQDEPLNATIYITGCGLDIEIEHDDMDYRVADGVYEIDLAPKVGGTLTFTVENSTEDLEASKDYSVDGLKGTVTTSVDDDLFITVENQEYITADVTGGDYAEVRVSYFNRYWADASAELINNTDGDGLTQYEGLDGEFRFLPDEDFVENVGYLVVAAVSGNYKMFDIIEIEAVHDLVINITTPDEDNQTFTVGMENDIELQVTDSDGNPVDDCDSVVGEILNETGEVLQEFEFDEAPGEAMWDVDDDQIIWWPGTLLITATNNTDETEHDGNESFMVELATITYDPAKLTCGIGLEDITVEIYAVDANGNQLPEGTELYLNVDPDGLVDGVDDGDMLTIDEDGKAEFDIDEVFDDEGCINVTFVDEWLADTGNETSGELSIEFPTFIVDPDTIYIDMANTIEITANDVDDNPIEGINLTLKASTQGVIDSQPEPVETDANGQVILSVTPDASGKLNVTIARDLEYVDDDLQWDNAVVTDTIINVTSIKPITIKVSKSPIYEGETLTVTIESNDNPVGADEVYVEFGNNGEWTDENGQVDFVVPDPGVDSAGFEVYASGDGYTSESKTVTVINLWDISIIAPSGTIEKGKEYTFTIVAKGQPLAGATITLDGKEYTSGSDGKVKITVPDKTGEYTITATFPNYMDGTLTFTVKETPGFELLTLIVALGVAFILLRRRRQ